LVCSDCNIPCASCSYDPTREVLSSHEATIRFKWQSGNQINPYGAAKVGPWRYNKYKDSWKKQFGVVATEYPDATDASFYRLTLTRIYGKGPKGGRCYPFDLDNLAQGAKPMIDILVKFDVLFDDSPQYTEVHYKQEQSEDRKHYVKVLVEELAL